MVQFHRVTIADKTWVDGFVRAEDSRSADFNFGNIYMWDGAYHQLLSGVGGRLLTKLKWAQQPFFAFPIGEGDLRPAVDALTEFTAVLRRWPNAARTVRNIAASSRGATGRSRCSSSRMTALVTLGGGKKLPGLTVNRSCGFA